MAFVQEKLSLMAYTGAGDDQSNHLWFYATPESDNPAAGGYFNDVLELREGDHILCSSAEHLVVTSADPEGTGAVTVTDVTVTDIADGGG